MENFNRENIQFNANGTILRGWFYYPEKKEKLPTIIMAPGWNCVKEFYLDKYAEVFAKAGFAVLVFDNRGFGDSGGDLRQEIDPWVQINDYRSALSFAQTLDSVDSSRLGLWGISYSGAHSLVTAAIDRRVKCVISVVSMISGYQTTRRRYRPLDWQALQKRFAEDQLNRFTGNAPAMIPTVISTSETASHPDKTAHDFFTGASVSGEEKWRFKNWTNEITLKSIEMYSNYEPATYIKRISPTPLLMIIANNDTISQTDLQLQAYEDALHPKKLVMMNGDHFCPYIEQFSIASDACIAWFKEHL